jgi:hypothetical protein
VVFAFNLGAQEFIVLLLGGLCFAGVSAIIVVLVVLLTRRQSREDAPNRQSALEAENQRLREELDKLKRNQT